MSERAPGHGLPLIAYRGVASLADMSEFLARHPATCYLLHHGPLDPSTRRKAWQETASVSVQHAPLHTPAQHDFLVFPVLPREGAQFVASVSVGRASNNDVVIEDESISKCHAHIRLDDGLVRLFDDGSSVGTFVGGRKLLPRQALELTSGSPVRFGHFDVVFMRAEDFHSLLRGLFK